jgi:uncharacterized protein
VRTEIIQKLEETAAERHIRILYACESGSRAWGFASPDSDYDVRFIYCHEPDWYVSIEDKKDHISLPVNEVFDIVGYDVRKMLKLFRSSNAKIYEWLQSPVIYAEALSFRERLKPYVLAYYAPRAGIHHYLGLTKNTLDNELQGELVKLKKYFYALRPVLAASWIRQHNTCPPMEFAPLRSLIQDAQIQVQLDELLAVKVQQDEKYVIKPIPALHDFIRDEWNRCSLHAQGLSAMKSGAEPLNKFFRSIIGF